MSSWGYNVRATQSPRTVRLPLTRWDGLASDDRRSLSAEAWECLTDGGVSFRRSNIWRFRWNMSLLEQRDLALYSNTYPLADSVECCIFLNRGIHLHSHCLHCSLHSSLWTAGLYQVTIQDILRYLHITHAYLQAYQETYSHFHPSQNSISILASHIYTLHGPSVSQSIWHHVSHWARTIDNH